MIEPDYFKSIMRRHAAAVVVIAVKTNDGVHCMTATSFVSVSVNPSLVLFCVHKENETHERLLSASKVGISLLADGQANISNRFASKGAERYRLDDIQFPESPDGLPLVPDACTHFEVSLIRRHWGGDHSIFVGEVCWADVRNEVVPLVYHAGGYRSLHVC
jgi:flavin reductase (DIM6/NTAB) family NADH-FMN oxidoreductase RutF